MRILSLFGLVVMAAAGCSSHATNAGVAGTSSSVSGNSGDEAGNTSSSGNSNSSTGGSAGRESLGAAGASGAEGSAMGGGAGTPSWDACNSVRLTMYPAADVAWCSYSRTAPMLPDFVRNGLTLAIAEPYDGSSYGGDPGEACGECWEITSLTQTVIAMVHDLCPIQGNPLCTGSHFDFDLSLETGTALGLDGLDEGRARRVACPVTGNAYMTILGRDQWGSVRFQVINQRFPVRAIEYHAVGSSTYYAAQRSAGAWAVDNDHRDMFNESSTGGSFRITSARGEVVEMPNVLTYDFAIGSYFDFGAQFTGDLPAVGGQCEFVPPQDVYLDGYGGIEDAAWVMNPWASASPSEVTTGCCIRVTGMEPASGFHIFYRQNFAPSTFKTLHFQVRAEAGSGTVDALLTSDTAACARTSVPVSEAWSEATIDIASTCAGIDLIRNVTFNGATPLTLLFDNIRFEL
jgi:hypothetical protein